ncbi:MAG: N-acetyltransferase, partial [Euryarchaeota archaeon]|nr:N-acetyltransferase [Euryarchaeota archaeon]
YAMIGAGSVVTKNVSPFGLVYGTPALLKGFVCYCGKRLSKIIEDIEEKVIYECECGKNIEIKKEWMNNA